MKFSSKHFAEMMEDYGAPKEEMEMIFSVFDGLSKEDFFNILDKIDGGSYEGKINDCDGLSYMARKIIDDFFVEGEPTATEKDFIQRVKKLNLKATAKGKGIAISMQKQTTDTEECLDDEGHIKENVLLLKVEGHIRKYIGTIGSKTDIKDKNGRVLKIGDMVVLTVGGKKDVPLSFVTVVCEFNGNATLFGCGERLDEESFDGRKYDVLKIRDIEDMPMNFRFAYSTDKSDLSIIEYHNNINGIDDYEEIDKSKMS